MRNWPYAYALGNEGDSAIKGKFDVTTLPIGEEGDRSAATLGGWNLAVPKYRQRSQKRAIELVKFLASPEQQKVRALVAGNLPTIKSLYDDARDCREAADHSALEAGLPERCAATLGYDQASSITRSRTISGPQSTRRFLARAQRRTISPRWKFELTKLKGAAW